MILYITIKDVLKNLLVDPNGSSFRTRKKKLKIWIVPFQPLAGFSIIWLMLLNKLSTVLPKSHYITIYNFSTSSIFPDQLQKKH